MSLLLALAAASPFEQTTDFIYARWEADTTRIIFTVLGDTGFFPLRDSALIETTDIREEFIALRKYTKPVSFPSGGLKCSCPDPPDNIDRYELPPAAADSLWEWALFTAPTADSLVTLMSNGGYSPDTPRVRDLFNRGYHWAFCFRSQPTAPGFAAYFSLAFADTERFIPWYEPVRAYSAVVYTIWDHRLEALGARSFFGRWIDADERGYLLQNEPALAALLPEGSYLTAHYAYDDAWFIRADDDGEFREIGYSLDGLLLPLAFAFGLALRRRRRLSAMKSSVPGSSILSRLLRRS